MKLIDPGEKITESEIAEFEDAMGVRLPEDYKAFMMNQNGGVPEVTTVFQFSESDPENGETSDTESDVQNFSILDELPFFYKNLIDEGAIPDKYLPIACDSCGNEILLCADESEKYGNIYFGNHELFEITTSYFNRSLIADSFTEFINMLYAC